MKAEKIWATCDRKAFARAMGLAQMALRASRQGTIIRMAKGKGLTVYRYASGLSVLVNIPCEVSGDVELLTFPGENYQAIDALPGNEIRLEWDGDARLAIDGGPARLSYDVNEYDESKVGGATEPGFKPAATVEMEGKAWADAVAICMESTSKHETRKNLMGVNLARNGDGVYMESTDDHRMTRLELPMKWPTGAKGPQSILLPASLIVPALTLRRHERVQIQITNAPKGEKTTVPPQTPRVRLILGNAVLTDAAPGKFPSTEDTWKKIPDKGLATVRVEVAELALAVSLARMTDLDPEHCPFKMQWTGKGLLIGTENTLEMTLACEGAGEKNTFVGLNANYLQSVIRQARGADTLEFQLNGLRKPVGVRIVGRADYKGMIMPMLIEWGQEAAA